MMNTGGQLKIGIILNYINLIMGNLIPIFYTPIMLFLLGQSEYGLYKIASSTTSYLSLMSLGIGAAVTRYLIKANTEEGKEAEERTLGLFVIIFWMIAAVTLVVGSIVALNLDLWYGKSLNDVELSRMKILVFLMVCNTSIGFSLTPYVSVVNTHERFVFLQSMNIISTCLGPLLNLAVLYLGYASIGMTVATLSISVTTRFIYLFYIKNKMKITARYRNMPTHLLKEILVFSFWVFVANIVIQLYNATDVVLIGAIPALATSGVAIYSIGATFNNIVGSLTIGISSLLAPKTNRMVFEGANNTELTDLAIRVGRLQCYIATLIVTGFVAFGQPFISFYVGKGYEQAYWIAIVMMVPNVIPLVQSVFLSIITAQNKHKFRSLVYLGIAIINVFGTWVLLHKMGIIGAALMTGLALIVGQGFIMNWYYWKKTGLEVARFWREVGKIFIIPSGMVSATLFVARFVDFYNIIAFCIGIITYTLIYCGLNYRFVMNPYEKKLIEEPLKLAYKRLLR